MRLEQRLHRLAHSGHLFCFRGRQGGLIKVIWHDGQGACLFTKKLERGFWPSAVDGTVVITPAQLGYLLEDIDRRMPQKPGVQARRDEQNRWHGGADGSFLRAMTKRKTVCPPLPMRWLALHCASEGCSDGP
ncbi:IS66 family insertion sequence element accessory protein TnpB, partial [Mesorhizobium sp.]|uniref:IS66 family insertion sequence element accessory protein TnpB n=1 Tax=Mesorhizobium sp. TaxID=1871066 RepID=UPI0025B7C1E0